MPRTYKDDVISELAAQVAELAERAVRAEHDRDTYRRLAVALACRFEQTSIDRDRLEERYHRLLDEHRRLRAGNAQDPVRERVGRRAA